MTDDQTSHAHAAASTADDRRGHSSGHADVAETPATRLELASAPATIVPGATTRLNLRIVDAASGRPVPEFAPNHEKLMHLIVVSKDLAWFNHIHPKYRGNGEFTIDVELPRAGDYRLYADYTPRGGSQVVTQHELATSGAPSTSGAELVPDRAGEGGWMLRTTAAHPEGEPDARGGDGYQVAMMPMPSTIIAGRDVMLHFQVRDAQGRPVNDLEPYLGAAGHAVVLSSDAGTYLHVHPIDHGPGGHGEHAKDGGHGAGVGHGGHAHDAAAPSVGPDVMFHTNFPGAGLYKVWGQFQREGRIITASFVLRVS